MIDLSISRRFKPGINTSRLELALKTTLELVGCGGHEGVTLKITDNKTIQELNNTHRQLNEPTDVLSFENDYIDLENGIHFIGDIVISFEKALAQAQDRGHTVQYELEMLLVHGILHLYGYDHITQAGVIEMNRLQDKILTSINNPLIGSINDEDQNQ